MSMIVEYERATRDAELARLRRVMAVRGMLAEGYTQRELAEQLGVSQPAVSYLASGSRTDDVRPSDLLVAASPLLKELAENRGFTALAVFGSVARKEDRTDSDLDLIVQPPDDADLFDMVRLEEDLSRIMGKDVDLISYRGLDPEIDQDILRDRVLL